MSVFRYRVVDVFTNEPLAGNPLAVFPDARGLSDEQMQKIAKELNLSETVFLFPPSSAEFASKLRIFTPNYEMVFAGHPTIGASYIIIDETMVPRGTERFVLEEKVGPVPIRVDYVPQLMIWLTTPPIAFGKTYERADCARGLNLAESDFLADVPIEGASAGNPNVYIALRDKAAVDRASCDRSGADLILGEHDTATCLFVFTPTESGAYSRMFAPELGVVEDPATGSATGPLAAFMMKHGLVSHAAGTRFISEQGTKMGRRSLLHVLVRGDHGSEGIEIGGEVAPLTQAQMTLP